MTATLTTERLRLRGWLPEDRGPFAALNADPEVMAHYPAVLSRAQSDTYADRIEAHFGTHGFGLWAAERLADATFIGFVGLQHVPIDAHFTPAVEVGWRLRRDAWGHGYATEGARAAAEFAFTQLELSELVAMTTVDNERSQRVMQRLGMRRDPADDFCYSPAGAPGSTTFVLYRLAAPSQLAVPVRPEHIRHG